jgi:hypothetical protein
MIKYLLIFVLLISTATAINDLIVYDDYILSVYNSSYIETANYLFVKVNNTDYINQTEGEPLFEFVGSEILVIELKQLNKNTCLADITIL